MLLTTVNSMLVSYVTKVLHASFASYKCLWPLLLCWDLGGCCYRMSLCVLSDGCMSRSQLIAYLFEGSIWCYSRHLELCVHLCNTTIILLFTRTLLWTIVLCCWGFLFFCSLLKWGKIGSSYFMLLRFLWVSVAAIYQLLTWAFMLLRFFCYCCFNLWATIVISATATIVI